MLLNILDEPRFILLTNPERLFGRRDCLYFICKNGLALESLVPLLSKKFPDANIGIGKNIEQCTAKLHELQNALRAQENGTVKKGRKPTLESVQNQVEQILKKEFTRELFDVQISKVDIAIRLS